MYPFGRLHSAWKDCENTTVKRLLSAAGATRNCRLESEMIEWGNIHTARVPKVEGLYTQRACCSQPNTNTHLRHRTTFLFRYFLTLSVQPSSNQTICRCQQHPNAFSSIFLSVLGSDTSSIPLSLKHFSPMYSAPFGISMFLS